MPNFAGLQAAILNAPVLRAVFFAPGRCLVSFAFAALIAAHLFLVAAMIASRPAADSLRPLLGASDVTASACFFAVHLFLCASPMRFRAAKLIMFRFPVSGTTVRTGPAALRSSIARSLPICESMCRFCSSNPRIAAAIISGVSLWICIWFSDCNRSFREVSTVL
jgi:hypothetical protein